MTPSAALFLTCSMMATSEGTVALSCEDGTTCTLRTSEASAKDLLREESRAALQYAPGAALQPGGDRVRQRRGDDLWMAASGGEAPAHRVAVCQGPESERVEARVEALVAEGEAAWGAWRGRRLLHPVTDEPMAVPVGCVPFRNRGPAEVLRCGPSTLTWMAGPEDDVRAEFAALPDLMVAVDEATGWEGRRREVACTFGGLPSTCLRERTQRLEPGAPVRQQIVGFRPRGDGTAWLFGCVWAGEAPSAPDVCGALITTNGDVP